MNLQGCHNTPEMQSPRTKGTEGCIFHRLVAIDERSFLSYSTSLTCILRMINDNYSHRMLSSIQPQCNCGFTI